MHCTKSTETAPLGWRLTAMQNFDEELEPASTHSPERDNPALEAVGAEFQKWLESLVPQERDSALLRPGSFQAFARRAKEELGQVKRDSSTPAPSGNPK